jgi:hypothetical protein
MEQQDKVGAIMGMWPTMNLQYFSTFYYTPGDFLTEGEVEFDSKVKKIKGAQSKALKQQQLTLNDFIQYAKTLMLSNGGQ